MRPSKRKFALLLLILLWHGSAGAELDFGVVPQQAAGRVAQLWVPLLNEVRIVSGEQLRFQTAPDIPTFERRLAAGEYDLAYMNPYHYTLFSRAPGYRALAKQANKRIRGIIVVAVDSPYHCVGAKSDCLQQLNRQRLAFPSPAAFAASILTRGALRRHGVAFDPVYVNSHDSVYLAVSRGWFAAGGGIERTFSNLTPSTRNQLRILWRTPGYTPHAFAIHPRHDGARAQRITDALVNLNRREKGRRLLSQLGMEAIVAAADADWNDVRKLQIDLLEHLVEKH